MAKLDRRVDAFLDYLGLDREQPSLDYLNALVGQHQLQVPFETLTKIIDYERGYRERDFLPDIERYVADLSKANGYAYVYSYSFGGNLIYGDRANDITPLVVAGLNETYKPGTELE